MAISKISYNKIYPTSQFLNERIGVEVEINPGDDPHEALRSAKAICDEFHEEANPDLYKLTKVELTAEEANTIKEINLCETPNKLLTYQGFLTKNTKPYYLEKLKELTHKKSKQ